MIYTLLIMLAVLAGPDPRLVCGDPTSDACNVAMCLRGPAHQATTRYCLWPDLDGDGDVDLNDYAIMQREGGL